MQKIELLVPDINKTRLAVIISGFGELSLQLRYGILIKKTKRLLYVRIYEPDGEYYTETFSSKTGIRIQDIGNPDGWKVNLKELIEPKAKPNVKAKNQVLKVHEEVVKLASDDSIVYQVWRDVSKPGKDGFFLKAYNRRITYTQVNGKSISHEKHLPVTVPLTKLVEIFADFALEI